MFLFGPASVIHENTAESFGQAVIGSFFSGCAFKRLPEQDGLFPSFRIHDHLDRSFKDAGL